MKKIISTIIAATLLIPQITLAFTAVPWVATTTAPTLFQPNKFNGVFLVPYSPFYIASSTSQASIFPYASSTVTSVSQNSYFNTTESTVLSPQTFIGTTSLTFIGLSNGQNDAPANVLRQDAGTAVGYRTALNLVEADGSNFFPSDSGPTIDYSISAGTAGVVAMGRTSCSYDRPANFISGRCLFWARDSVSGLLTPFGGYDGFGAWLFGASSTEFRSAQFNFQSNTTRFTKAFEIDAGNNVSTSTNLFTVLGTGLTGIGTGTPTFQLDVVGTAGLYNGDTSGQFAIAASSDPRKKFYMGYDTTLGTNGSSFIQSVMSGNAYTNLLLNPNAGNVAIGSTTPIANLQVTNATSNATSTFEVGKSGQTRGTCEKRYRYDGTAIYVSYDNNNLQQVTTVTCASISGF